MKKCLCTRGVPWPKFGGGCEHNNNSTVYELWRGGTTKFKGPTNISQEFSKYLWARAHKYFEIFVGGAHKYFEIFVGGPIKFKGPTNIS